MTQPLASDHFRLCDGFPATRKHEACVPQPTHSFVRVETPDEAGLGALRRVRTVQTRHAKLQIVNVIA